MTTNSNEEIFKQIKEVQSLLYRLDERIINLQNDYKELNGRFKELDEAHDELHDLNLRITLLENSNKSVLNIVTRVTDLVFKFGLMAISTYLLMKQ